MYEIGISILYGRTGVCKIEDIGSPPYQKRDGQRYYKLRTVFSTSGELIYIPVDSRYLKIVERLVCEEFAVALQTGPDSIKKRLCAAMGA